MHFCRVKSSRKVVDLNRSTKKKNISYIICKVKLNKNVNIHKSEPVKSEGKTSKQ